MHQAVRWRLRRALCALALLLLAVPLGADAQTQGQSRGGRPGGGVIQVIEPGGEYTPPYIWFEPASRTFYGAAQSVTVHFCDAEQISGASTRIWLNGTQLTHTAGAVQHPTCTAVHRVATVNVTLQPGTNWVKARACETTATASCGTDSTSYVLSGTDATPPTAVITPASGTFTVPTMYATANWCDDGTLNLGSRQVTWNGSPVATSDGWQTGTDACWSSASSTAMLTLQNGPNTLQASIRDAAGNLSSVATATFTYAPALSLFTPSGVRRPGLCAAGCFDATVGYSTPSYVSLDAPRAAHVVYSSAHARPRGVVQLNLTEFLPTPPARVSLRLVRPDGTPQTLNDGRDAVFYDAANGTSRLSAWFDASAMETGTYRYRAEVTRHFASGAYQTDTLAVRVVVVNESASPFGAGWSLAGISRIHLPTTGTVTDGVTLTEGDGNAGFFAAAASCGPTGSCAYTSPPGEFTTLARGADNAFHRTSLEGDSAVFDASGRLVRVRDRFGSQTTFGYHPSGCNPASCIPGELATITDPAGKTISFTYSQATGLATSAVVLGAHSSLFFHDAQRDLTSVRDPDGVTAFTATYSGHRIASHTDRAQNRTDFAYDRWGTLATVVGPVFRAQGSAAYRDTTRFRSQEMAILPTGAQGTSLDPADRVDTATVRALMVDARGDSVRLALDGWGAAAEARDSRGYVTRSTRNAAGQTTSSSDALGNGVAYAWDGPRLTQTVESFANFGSRSVQREYNGPGGRLSREFGDAPETTYFYAGADRRFVLDSVHAAGKGTTRFTYDGRGRPLSVRDSANHATTYTYEPAGWMNLASTTTAPGRSTSYLQWDAMGRLTQTWASGDEGPHEVQYDVMGRLLTHTLPDYSVVRYYPGAAALDSVKDQRGQTWRWTRNQLGWVETEVRPGDAPGRHRTTVFDRRGRMVSSTDRRGKTVSLGYDHHDRPTSRSVNGVAVTTWSYSPDAPGTAAPSWVAVTVPGESTDSLHYDAQGRLTRAVTLRSTTTGARAYEITSTYTVGGQRDSLRYLANGVWKRARYHFDPSTGTLSFLRDAGSRTTYAYYNGEGTTREVYYPTGQVATYAYASNHLPSRIAWSGAGLNAAAGMELSYDGGNRILSRVTGSGTRYRDYYYDEVGRLYEEHDTQLSLRDSRCTDNPDFGWVCPDREGYTVVGDRIYGHDLTGNPSDRGAVVQPGNRLAAYDGWTMEYDYEGNLTRKYRAGQDVVYTWDDVGQMVQVTVNGGVAASYGYDGLGRRVRKSLPNGTVERYLYDEDDLLLQLDAAGAVVAEYTYWPGIDRPHSVLRGGAQYYYALDPQGSVLAMTDASGNVVNQYRYGGFGNAELVSETVANPLRYTGREWDATAGLYYVRARWYDPALQRFTSEDPLGIDAGLNLYVYAGNDPVNATDPTGLIPYCWTGIGLGGEMAWFLHDSCYGSFLGGFRMREMEARARGCYDLWRCSDSPFQNECQRFSDRWSGCLTHPVSEQAWGRVRTRIESIVVGAPECAGAKQALMDLWNRGREAGGIQFWNGRDYQYNRDGTPQYTSSGLRKAVLGYNGGNMVAFDSAAFFSRRSLPVHEGLHLYLQLTNDPRRNVDQGHPFINSVQGRCPATR